MTTHDNSINLTNGASTNSINDKNAAVTKHSEAHNKKLATNCYNTKTAVANHCNAGTKKLALHCYNTKGAVVKHRDVHNKTLAPHCYKRQQYQRCRSQRRVIINKTLAPYCYKDNNINAVVMSDASRSTRRLHRTATIINSSLNPSFLKDNDNPDTQPFDKVNLPTKA